MIAWESTVDVVVVGSGVAGLTTARSCAARGLRTLLVTKGAVDDGSTRWAQGGIAVVDPATGDSVPAHLQDTVVAGAGLTDPVAAAAIVTEGMAAVAGLRELGARFDTGAHGLLRTREGGHHRDRIIHAGGDATGAEVERALLAAPGLPAVLADHQALDVLTDDEGTACGISVLGPDGRIGLILARGTVLATGGSGQLFAASTNPAVATADGLAMALRAGAAVADLEFIQFHPTALFAGARAAAGGQLPLISEAVRGAGALLIDGAGHRVMTGVHPLEDLAPRDVVALAINRRLAENPGGIGDHVFLDARMIDGFARRFPTITASCAEAGIDPASEPIPVAPAAHYQCGGVDTDLRGRTTVAGLYAVGEVSRTGLHGANRLASNSLLEALVMGGRTAEDLAATIAGRRIRGAVDVVAPTVTIADPGDRSILQAAMSRSAGIVRDAAGLATIEPPATRSQGVNGRQVPAGVSTDPAPAGSPAGSMESIEPMGSELSDGVETANLALAARAVVRAATLRTESRGCHFRSDHPGRILGWAQPISLTLADGDLVVAELREAVAS